MMLQTLTEYLRERVRSLKSEYPDEPVCKEQVHLWRMEWRKLVLSYGNGSVDPRVAKSFLRVFGPRAIVELKYAANIDQLCKQA